MEAGDERRITVEALRERINSLDQQRRKAFATFNALHGAIQECEYWLSVLTEEKDDGGKVGS